MINAANDLKRKKYDTEQGQTNHQSRAKTMFIPCGHHSIIQHES